MRDRYVGWLVETADKMHDLALRLGRTGQTLDVTEKQLIRMAALPAMKEWQEEMLLSFIAGADIRETQAYEAFETVLKELKG